MPDFVLTGRRVSIGTEGTRNVEEGGKEPFILVKVTLDTDAMIHEYFVGSHLNTCTLNSVPNDCFLRSLLYVK